jgi:hypothetical protein
LLQDLTTYTEVDPNTEITVVPNVAHMVRVKGVPGTAKLAYLAKELTHPDSGRGRWHINLTLASFGAWPDPDCGVWGLNNGVIVGEQLPEIYLRVMKDQTFNLTVLYAGCVSLSEEGSSFPFEYPYSNIPILLRRRAGSLRVWCPVYGGGTQYFDCPCTMGALTHIIVSYMDVSAEFDADFSVGPVRVQFPCRRRLMVGTTNLHREGQPLLWGRM